MNINDLTAEQHAAMKKEALIGITKLIVGKTLVMVAVHYGTKYLVNKLIESTEK